MGLFTKLFGTYSERELKRIYPIVDKIEALEEEYKALTDAQLQANAAPKPFGALHFGVHCADGGKAGGRVEIEYQVR